MNRRVAAVCAVLGISSLLCFGAAAMVVQAGHNRLITDAPSTGDTMNPTAVLSARRVPTLLTQPVATRRVNSAVAPELEKLSETSCVVVNDGATRIVGTRPEVPLTPASNLKILTAFTALKTFGPDATFATKFLGDSELSGGVITGNLYMVGGGDPIIDTENYQRTQKHGVSAHTSLESIADSLVDLGLASITGSIIGDETRYDTERAIPTWPSRYVSQNQVGPLSALSVNDSRSYPPSGAISGVIRPASEPATYAAQALTQLLRERGVTIGGEASSASAPAGLQEILEAPSLPVSGLVQEMLTFSDNNTAELLLKELGRSDDQPGTTAAGLTHVSETIAEAAPDELAPTLIDGSGLDTSNRATCSLLEEVLRRDGPDGPLAQGLAIADGEVGTLEDRYTSSPAAGRVRAKTGTLNGVTALSGWVETTKGTDLSFSIIMNLGSRDVTGSDLMAQQRITEALLAYPDSVDPELLAPKPATR